MHNTFVLLNIIQCLMYYRFEDLTSRIKSQPPSYPIGDTDSAHFFRVGVVQDALVLFVFRDKGNVCDRTGPAYNTI
jgi:hypothetical protein